MRVIESLKNDRVKYWKKLKLSKERKKNQQYLIEGFHLIEEAIKFDADIVELMSVSSELIEEYSNNYEKSIITGEIAREISSTESNQGIFAVVAFPRTQHIDLKTGQRYLLLDQIQDPGNMGTMIRTADAAGFDAVIIGEASVDLYNDKVIRSAQGSHWHLPVISMNLDLLIEELKQENIQVVATALSDYSKSYKELENQKRHAIIIGNEGNGVRKELIEKADLTVHIPMPGQSESLNASIAAAIIMFYLV